MTANPMNQEVDQPANSLAALHRRAEARYRAENPGARDRELASFVAFLEDDIALIWVWREGDADDLHEQLYQWKAQ